MNIINVRRRISDNEKGVGILELAICLPFLLLALVAVVDIGRALVQYIQVSRISYEAVRYGVTISQLEDGIFDGPVGTQSLHSRIRSRVQTLLVHYNFDPREAQITTRLNPNASTTDDLLSVSVSVPLSNIFPGATSLGRIRVVTTGGHLAVGEEV